MQKFTITSLLIAVMVAACPWSFAQTHFDRGSQAPGLIVSLVSDPDLRGGQREGQIMANVLSEVLREHFVIEDFQTAQQIAQRRNQRHLVIFGAARSRQASTRNARALQYEAQIRVRGAWVESREELFRIQGQTIGADRAQTVALCARRVAQKMLHKISNLTTSGFSSGSEDEYVDFGDEPEGTDSHYQARNLIEATGQGSRKKYALADAWRKAMMIFLRRNVDADDLAAHQEKISKHLDENWQRYTTGNWKHLRDYQIIYNWDRDAREITIRVALNEDQLLSDVKRLTEGVRNKLAGLKVAIASEHNKAVQTGEELLDRSTMFATVSNILGNEVTLYNIDPVILPVYLLLDVSGSMKGEKIANLNQAVRDMLQAFAKEEQPGREIPVTIITFGGEAKLHMAPMQASQIKWQNLQASGNTPLGGALLIAEKMIEDQRMAAAGAHQPKIVLVSDGKPNDAWQQPLNDFINNGLSAKCDRMAMAIGQDCDKNLLQRFISGTSQQLFHAQEASQLSKFFQQVTHSVQEAMRQENIANEVSALEDPSSHIFEVWNQANIKVLLSLKTYSRQDPVTKNNLWYAKMSCRMLDVQTGQQLVYFQLESGKESGAAPVSAHMQGDREARNDTIRNLSKEVARKIIEQCRNRLEENVYELRFIGFDRSARDTLEMVVMSLASGRDRMMKIEAGSVSTGTKLNYRIKWLRKGDSQIHIQNSIKEECEFLGLKVNPEKSRQGIIWFEPVRSGE